MYILEIPNVRKLLIMSEQLSNEHTTIVYVYEMYAIHEIYNCTVGVLVLGCKLQKQRQ